MDIPAYSEFEEKVVLVTGGAGGIGKEICTQFAMQGAKIVALDVAEPGDL
ncbi:MAG: SDR family NAD(P)-dependent oxidoreductase, partial [Nanoarchaeota archaeon]|nr:SDR family NAD(P)-dependent oxidoreductase [Nanoarchaeota archaeon]